MFRLQKIEQGTMNMTMADACALLLADSRLRNSPTAQPTYLSHSRRLLADWGPGTELASITRRQVQQWVDRLSQEVSPATVRHLLSSFVRCYRLAWDTGADVSAPTANLRLPRLNNRRERVLSEEEEARLAAELSLDHYAVVKFAIHTGMRRLEQWRLRVDDIQLREHSTVPGPNGLIRVQVGVARIRTSKTGRGRVCPLNPVAAMIANAWVQRSRTGWLLPGGDNRLAVAQWAYPWSWRAESNRQPADYKSAALPIELHQRGGVAKIDQVVVLFAGLVGDNDLIWIPGGVDKPGVNLGGLLRARSLNVERLHHAVGAAVDVGHGDAGLEGLQALLQLLDLLLQHLGPDSGV